LASRTVRHLGQVELTFSEPVTGLDAGDLVVNGQPATNVSGISSGPYVFQFAAITNGAVQIDWSPAPGIQDLAEAPNPFVGASWSYTVDPTANPGEVVLSEFLAANETGLLDEDGEAQDWIELQNRGATSVDLEGWSLTDDRAFPANGRSRQSHSARSNTWWSSPPGRIDARSVPARDFTRISS